MARAAAPVDEMAAVSGAQTGAALGVSRFFASRSCFRLFDAAQNIQIAITFDAATIPSAQRIDCGPWVGASPSLIIPTRSGPRPSPIMLRTKRRSADAIAR